MDENTIREICSHSVLLSDYFCGIICWRNAETSSILMHKIGSFIIINYENSHWFAIQKTGKNIETKGTVTVSKTNRKDSILTSDTQ